MKKKPTKKELKAVKKTVEADIEYLDELQRQLVTVARGAADTYVESLSELYGCKVEYNLYDWDDELPCITITFDGVDCEEALSAAEFDEVSAQFTNILSYTRPDF